MNLEQLTGFFQWMTIINVGLLIFSAVILMLLRQTVTRMHGRLFGLTESQVAVVSYGYLGLYKIFVIVFNIVPYVALRLL